MGSFFIIAEISGLNQMFGLKDSPVTELVEKAKKDIYNSVKANLQIDGTFLIFKIDTNIEKAPVILEAAKILFELISGYSDELHEYSMALIYEKVVEHDAFMFELRKKYFIFCEDYSLVVENKIYKACGIKLENKKKFQIIKYDSSKEKKSINRASRIISPHEEKKLLSLISLPLFPPGVSVADSSIYSISSNSESFALLNLLNAIKKSYKNDDDYFVHIDLLKSDVDCIMPLYRSIEKELLKKVKDYLGKVELEFWELNYKRLFVFQSEFFKESFFSLYLLYIKTVFRIAENTVNPKIILITGLKNGNKDFFDYFCTLFNIIDREFSPILFMVDPPKKINDSKKSLKDYFKNVKEVVCNGDPKKYKNNPIESYQQRVFLFILKISEGILDKNQLESFLIDFGYNSKEIIEKINELVESGYIIDHEYMKVLPKIDSNELAPGLFDKVEVYVSFAKYLKKLMNEEKIIDYGLAAVKIKNAAGEKEIDEVLFLLLSKLLNYRKSNFVSFFLNNCQQLSTEIRQALDFRCNLINANQVEMERSIKSIIKLKVHPDTKDESYKLLEVARYFCGIQEYQKSLEISKNVLIYLQFGKFPVLEGRVFIEIGFIMLQKGRLIESSEYLNLAIEKLSNTNDKYNLMKAYLITALQQYIWGSLDQAINSTRKASILSLEGSFTEWHFISVFFQSRLFFELGRYEEVEILLCDCLVKTEVMKNRKRRKVLKSWLARACIYQGKIYRGLNMLLYINKDPEVLYFLSEAYFFNGNQKEAMKMIKNALDSDQYFEPAFLPMEHLDWANGFTFFEGRLFNTTNSNEVLKRNIMAFYAFILGLDENRKEGIELLSHLTNTKNVSKNDPFNRLYLNYYCKLLDKRSENVKLDKLTIMSKALKYLQQTTSRIKLPSIRQQFMHKNYWNSILVKNAEKENLL